MKKIKNKNKRSETLFKYIKKIKDKKTASKILELIFEVETNQKLLGYGSLFSKSKFNSALKDLIDHDFLGRDMEWVLVIPLEKYLKNGKDRYELVFGRGQEIDKKDLFIDWNNKTQVASIVNFKLDEQRRDVMSLYEANNLMTEYQMNKGIHPHYRAIRYATIENIKEYLEIRVEQKSKRILKASGWEKVLLRPEHLRTEFKHLNVSINLLNGACVIFLRDVFDAKYSFSKKGKENSFEFDAYSVVRKFLKCIGIYPERRAGVKERFRLSKDDEEVIGHYIQRDKEDEAYIFASSIPKPLSKAQRIKYMYHVASSALDRPVSNLTPFYQAKLISFLSKHL